MKAWERMNLGGGGLQGANIRLARCLKKARTAYLLWLFFPLGAHAIYLDRPRRALPYAALSAAGAALYAATADLRLAALPLGACAALALYDLAWIRRRLVELNKQIRMRVYLSQTPGAPEGFRGHYTDETADLPPRGRRAPSFAEQEEMLRELARRRKE